MIKKLVSILIGLGVSLSLSLQVSAVDLYNDTYTGESKLEDPLSWNQCQQPFSNDIYPVWGETYCQSSCGAHSLTWVMMKSKVWGKDKTPKDAWEFFSRNGWASPGSAGYGIMGGPGEEGGHTFTNKGTVSSSDIGTVKSFLVDTYNQGYYAIINVPGHLIAMDYVDSEGNVLVLDSAGTRCKYLECAMTKWAGGPTLAWAIEISGAPKSNASDAIRFWDGDAAVDGGGNSSNNNNSGGSSGGGNRWDLDTFDPFEPLDNPLVEYNNENVGKGVEDSNKGVQRKNTSWIDKLFGQ